MVRRFHNSKDAFANAWRRFLIACIVVLSVCFGSATPAAAQTQIDQQALSGAWYNPPTAGQGLMIDLFENFLDTQTGYVFASWFTFDDAAPGGADRQRWYTLDGAAPQGADHADLSIYRSTGGVFNAPPIVPAQKIGTAKLTVSACDRAKLDYVFDDGRHGSIALERIVAAKNCNGVPAVAAADAADFALSGNWFVPAQSGQGLSVDINPAAGTAFAAWYTYANPGSATGVTGQRWYTAQGAFTRGTRFVQMGLYETTAGRFNDASASPSTARVGDATMTWTDCNHATLAFSFGAGSSSGQRGTIALDRAGPTPVECAPPLTQAAGYWKGSSRGRDVRTIIPGDDSYYIVFSSGGVDSGVIRGTATIENGVFASANGRESVVRVSAVEGNYRLRPATVAGSFVAGKSLDLTIQRADGSAAEVISLVPDATYDVPAHLDEVAASYRGISGVSQGALPVAFAISPSGVLAGNNLACRLEGTVAPRGSSNLFDITLYGRSDGCIFGEAATTGIGWYDPSLGAWHSYSPWSAGDNIYYLNARKF